MTTHPMPAPRPRPAQVDAHTRSAYFNNLTMNIHRLEVLREQTTTPWRVEVINARIAQQRAANRRRKRIRRRALAAATYAAAAAEQDRRLT